MQRPSERDATLCGQSCHAFARGLQRFASKPKTNKAVKSKRYIKNGSDVTPSSTRFASSCFQPHFFRVRTKMSVMSGRDVTLRVMRATGSALRRDGRTSQMRSRRQQQNTGTAHVQFRFRVHRRHALQRIQKEAPKGSGLAIVVTELIRQLLPTHHAGFAQMKQAMHQPRIHIQIHRTLPQLFNR